MRRHLALTAAVLVLAACAKTETPAADSPAAAAPPPAALTNADLMGTWEATGMPMDRDTVVVRYTITNTVDSSTVVFASGERVKSAAGTISGDSVVSVVGPFKSQLRRGQQVTTRMVSRRDGDRLVGTIHAKYANGDTASFRVTATKKP